VTVTDLSERMLAAAAENAARRGLRNFKTQVCDAGALPFADASFDAVLCRFGFMFFPEVASAAREFARVAMPGARVCAAVWSAPEKNTPRRSRRFVSAAKNVSTAFSHEHAVGVKWNTKRGWRDSQANTFGFLWVA